jgi:hypothetical protein
MSCGLGCEPNEFQPEYRKQWKPESNTGCCSNGSSRNDCDQPSLARAGSPLAEWEAIYGKLVTIITYEQDDQGHSFQKVEKIPCPLKSTNRPSRHGCCSFRYKTIR